MKAFYAALLIVLSLIVAMGVSVFIRGAQDHHNRPLVALDDSGVQARLDPSFPRAEGGSFYVHG